MNESKLLNQYLYYFIIFIVSVLTLVFIPLLTESTLGIGLALPSTAGGWVVYVITRLTVAGINILLYDCFIKQARVNIKDDKKYIEANEILTVEDRKRKDYIPRSPKQFFRKEYGTKGITIFITSLMAMFAFTQAIIKYDFVTLLTYLFTVIMGIVFGFIEMKKVEAFWTIEYYEYAVYVQNSNKEIIE